MTIATANMNRASLPLAILLAIASPSTAGNSARFVSETINDYTIFLTGTTFTKSWTLRNTGDTTWDSSYKLAYVSGPLSDQADIPLEGTVAPNATYTFTKEMTAPDSSGNKREDWRLVAPDGSTIKVGSSNTIYTIIYVTLTADAAAFVSETVPDGTQFVAGTPFVKQWTIRNKGISTWHPGYELRFHSGGDLSDHQSIPVTSSVPPNANFTFAKAMTAPAAAGPAREDWEFANPEGIPFKISNSNTAWASIQVATSPLTDWLASHAVPLAGYGAYADPDADGSCNLLEFASNTSPVQASEKPDTGALPPGGIHFRRRPDRTSLTYEIQESDGLTGWQPVVRSTLGQPAERIAGQSGTITEDPVDDGSVRVIYQPGTAPLRRFLRLAVTQAP